VAIPFSAFSANEEYDISTPIKQSSGGYRKIDTSGQTAITEAGDPVYYTFRFVTNYFEITYKATTGTEPLEVQLFRASENAAFVDSSDVFYIYPDDVKPFPLKGIKKIKANLSETDAVGEFIVDYYGL
jgi:hypothetical protein